MARITIDQDLFNTAAWTKLLIKSGKFRIALGSVAHAWLIAQRYWVPDRRPIPRDVWIEEEIDDNLIGTFAEEVEDGYFIKLSEEQFAWLMSKHSNGSKGGRPKKTEEKPQENPKTETETENLKNLTKPMKPSSSFSYSSSYSLKEEGKSQTRTSDPPSEQEETTELQEYPEREPPLVEKGESQSSQVPMKIGEEARAIKKLAKRPRGSPLPRIARIWNECKHPCMPSVSEMAPTSRRRKACEARWRERPDEEFWRKVIWRINGSSFCRGDNDRNWVANIEFLTRTDTPEKILEGKYDDKDLARGGGFRL